MKKEDIDAIKKDAADRGTAGGLDEAIARHLGWGHAVARNAGRAPSFLAPDIEAVQAEIESAGKSKPASKARPNRRIRQ